MRDCDLLPSRLLEQDSNELPRNREAKLRRLPDPNPKCVQDRLWKLTCRALSWGWQANYEFSGIARDAAFVASLSQAQAVTAIQERLADDFRCGFAGQGRQFSGESRDFRILKSQRHYCIFAKFSKGGAGRQRFELQ